MGETETGEPREGLPLSVPWARAHAPSARMTNEQRKSGVFMAPPIRLSTEHLPLGQRSNPFPSKKWRVAEKRDLARPETPRGKRSVAEHPNSHPPRVQASTAFALAFCLGERASSVASTVKANHTTFISGLPFGSLSLQPVDLLAPMVGADRASTQPTGTFTSGLSTVWSPAPPPDITTETTGQFSLAGLSPLERQLASLQPLIEPDRQISRIRLSEKTHNVTCDAVCNF